MSPSRNRIIIINDIRPPLLVLLSILGTWICCYHNENNNNFYNIRNGSNGVINPTTRTTSITTTITTTNIHEQQQQQQQQRRRHLAPIPGIPIFPKTFVLEPIAHVSLPDTGCCPACVNSDSSSPFDLTCHIRPNFREQIISRVDIDATTYTVKTTPQEQQQKNPLDNIFYGDDPRSFLWNGDIYILKTHGHDNTLIRLSDGLTIDLPSHLLNQKSITPVPLSGHGLLFIDFHEAQLSVCLLPDDSSSTTTTTLSCEPFWKEVMFGHKPRSSADHDSFDPSPYHRTGTPKYGGWYHRGGTPGVEIKPNTFVGFGHAKYRPDANDYDVDGVYYWYLDLRPEKAYMFMDHKLGSFATDEEEGRVSYPTSLVNVGEGEGGEWVVMAVEMGKGETWVKKGVEVENRVYRIVERECQYFGFCDGESEGEEGEEEEN